MQNDNNQKVERWQPWQYQLDLFDIIQQFNTIYILKASQIGISWVIAIYNLWLANFSQTAQCLLFSQGQVEAEKLLDKVKFIHEHLPDYLKFPVSGANNLFLSFKGNYAEIRALPSTDKSGHGFQATLVTRDEVARHPYARDNFKAIARSGGKIIELSTANNTAPPEKQEYYWRETTYTFWKHPSTVKKVYESGLELFTNPEMPTTCMVFLNRWLRPTRIEGKSLQQWFKEEILSKWRQEDIDEQFPEKIEDTFRGAGIQQYFDEATLDAMGQDLCPPIKQTEINTYNGIIRIYKLPIVGRRYVVFTDPSLGVDDPFVTRVKDCATGERVASACGKVKVDFAAQIHDSLVRAYNNAANSFEYNGSCGGEFSSLLKDLNTPNMRERRDDTGKVIINRKGQYVTEPLKKAMMEHENLYLSKRHIINHDKEYLQQARMVLRASDLPIMDKHQSFDWVMADAHLEWVDKWLPRGIVRAETVRDL